MSITPKRALYCVQYCHPSTGAPLGALADYGVASSLFACRTGICMSLIRHRPKTDRLMAGLGDLFSAGTTIRQRCRVSLSSACAGHSRPPGAEKERAFERDSVRTAGGAHRSLILLSARGRALAFSPLLLA